MSAESLATIGTVLAVGVALAALLMYLESRSVSVS